MKNLWNRIRMLLEVRGNIIKHGLVYVLDYIKKYEKSFIIFSYIWLFCLSLVFFYIAYKEFTLLKWVIYLIWIFLTYFILRIYSDLSLALEEIKEQKFLIYSFLFFWMNISCAFFLYDQILHDLLYDIWSLIENLMK